MHTQWTRRQFLARVGAAAAVIQTFDHLDPCCVLAADSKTADKDLFELTPVADGIYAAVAAPRFKVNSNAAVILTNDGVVVVDSHSKRFKALPSSRSARSSIPIFTGTTGRAIRSMPPLSPTWKLSPRSAPGKT